MSFRPVRRTQAVTPFGVGAMVDFPGPVSLIHCGLDSWPFKENDPDHTEFRIEDEKRLAMRLKVEYFVQPPDFRYARIGAKSDQPNLNLKLPFLRFPRWHVCPRCGLMYEAALHDKTAPICEGPVGSGKDKGKKQYKRKTVQVRFIAACTDGHLQDFPWWEWVFQHNKPIKNGRLRMITSGSASLAGVRIECEEISEQIKVIKRRTLAGAFNYTLGLPSSLSRIEVLCEGNNPALGIPSSNFPSPGCGNHLYPLLRGSSNVYFPHTVSSIYIPPIDNSVSEEILEILENYYVWTFLSLTAQVAPDNKVSTENAEVAIKKYYPDREIDPKDLAEAANRKIANEDNDGEEDIVKTDTQEQAYRRQEYNLFCQDVQEGYPKTNLLIRSEDISLYDPNIRKWFERISLIHKLRETRAFVGFSRIFPVDTMDDEQRRMLLSHTSKNWLPAIIVRGEGVFLKLREEKIKQWIENNINNLNTRIRPLVEVFENLLSRHRQLASPVTPRFVMLHTLSHLLINQLIYDCGYGSASLRERLYSADGECPMSGILIYTAAGDSEGTMGGLVRMGQPGRIEGTLKRAIEKARWCSTDPVCIESKGQGPDNCNLAACHSCCLVPETSCEEQNRFLDRGLIVGTLSQTEIGFFKSVY